MGILKDVASGGLTDAQIDELYTALDDFQLKDGWEKAKCRAEVDGRMYPFYINRVLEKTQWGCPVANTCDVDDDTWRAMVESQPLANAPAMPADSGELVQRSTTPRRLAEDNVQTHEILAAGALCLLSFTVFNRIYRYWAKPAREL